MASKWKKNIDEGSYLANWAEDKENLQNITYLEMQQHPPKMFVEKVERWCEKYNPETFGRIKKFQYKEKNCYFLIKNILPILGIKDSFMVGDVLRILDRNGLSDGGLQRKILNFMVCEGILKKRLIEKNSKGEQLKKPYFKYFVPQFILICPNFKKDKCSFDWKHLSKETRYFQNGNSK